MVQKKPALHSRRTQVCKTIVERLPNRDSNCLRQKPGSKSTRALRTERPPMRRTHPTERYERGILVRLSNPSWWTWFVQSHRLIKAHRRIVWPRARNPRLKKECQWARGAESPWHSKWHWKKWAKRYWWFRCFRIPHHPQSRQSIPKNKRRTPGPRQRLPSEEWCPCLRDPRRPSKYNWSSAAADPRRTEIRPSTNQHRTWWEHSKSGCLDHPKKSMPWTKPSFAHWRQYLPSSSCQVVWILAQHNVVGYSALMDFAGAMTVAHVSSGKQIHFSQGRGGCKW